MASNIDRTAAPLSPPGSALPEIGRQYRGVTTRAANGADVSTEGGARRLYDLATPGNVEATSTPSEFSSEAAIDATLAFIAGLPGGGEVVFDYANPPHAIADERSRAAIEALAARVARAGESIVSYFETPALIARLGALGFAEVEDLGPTGIAARYAAGLPGRLSGGGAHLMRAGTLSRTMDEDHGQRRRQP